MTTIQPTFDDLLAHLERQRERGQVHYDDKQQCWLVLGHPEANRVLSDPATFSSDLSELSPKQDELDLLQRGNFIGMDPPQHRKLRTLVSQAFTPKMVAGLEPRIAELTTSLLDATEGSERFDLIDELAYPLPMIVIADLLGIPTSDQALFRVWADTLMSSEDVKPDVSLTEIGEKAIPKVLPTIREMNAYFLDHIRSRQLSPREDLTSELVSAEVDGERLTAEEIVGFVGLLLLAGHVTTTATLGNSVVCFQDNPEAAAEVRADPTLLPAAIEEVLRYRTPFPRLARITRSEVAIGEAVVPAGHVVVPWITAANRDGRVFADPDRFDIHRASNPHLTFGHGIHFCLGAPLARLEAKVAWRILFDRYREISVATDVPVEHVNPWVMVSVTKLPVRVRHR